MKAYVKSDWERTILVCGKCSKRLDGGFGKKNGQSLAKALRRYLGIQRWRKSRYGIVEVKCLGVCPRGGVTVVDAAHPERWRIIPAGTDIAAVANGLELAPPDQA